MTDFVTADDLASFMELESSDDLPASSELALAAAQQAVRKYVDQELTYVEDDLEVRDGNDSRKIRLRQRPVRAVTEVAIDGDVLAEDSYVVRGAVVTLVDQVFTRGIANVEITYDHGWDLAGDEASSGDDADDDCPFPADIQLVTLSVARRYMQRWGSSGLEGEIMMETIGDYSYTLHPDKRHNDHDLLRYEAAVLERYAVRLVP